MYTQNTGSPGLRNIKTALDQHFTGYTLEPKAQGRYKSTSEASVIAHVLTHDRRAVRRAAAKICELNNQESVLCIELALVWASFVPRSNFKKRHGRGPAARPVSAGKLHSRLGRRKRVSKAPGDFTAGRKAAVSENPKRVPLLVNTRKAAEILGRSPVDGIPREIAPNGKMNIPFCDECFATLRRRAMRDEKETQ